ncbi:MAG: hypothetical protein HUJ54_07085 [Erysipelotrichaceae bacterium]|nr:hypothetical protein [Erysipelotrichaceae bacterium]
MMSRIKLSLETMQMEAYTRKEVLLAGIEESGMDINGVYTAFPKGMACTPAKIYFNEKGNTAAAGHFTCFQGSQTWKLVWQLGQGRIRIEPV